MRPKFSIDETRLERYITVSDAAFEAARGISADIRQLREERMRLQLIVERNVQNTRNGYKAEDATETAKINDLSRKIERLEASRETQSARAQHHGRIAEACREYALPQPSQLGGLLAVIA